MQNTACTKYKRAKTQKQKYVRGAHNLKNKILKITASLLLLCIACALAFDRSNIFADASESEGEEQKKDYIKWAELTVCDEAMEEALKLDIKNKNDSDGSITLVRLLSLYSAVKGGNYENYKKGDIEKLCTRLQNGESEQDICKNAKLLSYYKEVYQAIFGGFVGDHKEWSYNDDGTLANEEQKYGLMLFSPIASGYYYRHYDDFGNSRSYGYKRKHLGHDLLGSVGTPIVAVEAGTVVACGWNQYGGWRVGIRSFDNKRYWYYAHMRKGHPYNDMYVGKTVDAGEVIGYLGMTGYSAKEDTNNIDTPHLHFGLQIIFDESQKDGTNQIWLDMYALTAFLSKNKAEVYSKSNEKYSKRTITPNNSPD